VLEQKVVGDAFALALLLGQIAATLVAAVAVLHLIYQTVPGGLVALN